MKLQGDILYRHFSQVMRAQTSMIYEKITLNMLRTLAALLVNYLDLGGSRAFSFFFCAFRVLSWFLDEGKWFIHDWCVVHMGGQKAGGAGCWTPGRCGALWPVKHHRCCCCSLGSFTTASAQRPLPPETFIHQNMSHRFDLIYFNSPYFNWCNNCYI